jgi:hypothetical protein
MTVDVAPLTADQERLVRLVVERAEQACRYAWKHNSDRLEHDRYADGFETGCEVCEKAIAEHVARHIAQDLAAG